MKKPLIVLLLTMAAIGTSAQEICDNALDDDADGLIDLNDTTDCFCTGVVGGGNGVESIIPNPSFEVWDDCCPSSYSQLYCAETWEQATDATSDFYHLCGFMPPVVPLPLPDGDGIVAALFTFGWLEYIGGNLLTPMLANEEYTLSMMIAATATDGSATTFAPIYFGDVDVTIFGYTTPAAFPVFTAECPEPEGWVELGHVTYTPVNLWTNVSITFTPTTDIAAIMIGPPCTLPADYDDDPSYLPYFFFDNMVLNESSLFSNLVVEGELCANNLVIYGETDTLATAYQWYQDGVAIIGQTDTVLHVSDLGLGVASYQFLTNASDTACAFSSVDVDYPPDAYPVVTAAPMAGCVPLAVTFNDATAGTVASCHWTFGDGGTSDACDTLYTYTEDGTYDVSLSVIMENGCPYDTTYLDLVSAYAVSLASFTADPVEGCTGMTVAFTNNSVNNAECSWTFGDPPASDLCDPTHTYNTAGVYDVFLSVTSANGCQDDTLMQDLITVYDEPTVSFTSDTSAGCTPLTIQFTNTTPVDQVGSVEWDLGNGTVTDQDNPVGLYTEPGLYTVSLLVTHPQGCQAVLEEVDMITAYGHPVVTFTNEPDSGCYPLEVAFSNTTDPVFTNTCSWSFGDGGTSTSCDTVNVYADPGVYSVSLEVISPQNCQGDTTYTDLITVFDHPVAEFTFGPQPTDYFNTYISFVDASSIDAIQWDWSFGVNASLGTSTDEFPSLHFPSEDLGTYPVQLIVTNVHTCTDTITHEVVIDGYYAVYVPNTFTPDGDGVNDLWRPMIKDQIFQDYELRLFDRWGQEIWVTTDPNEGWDGKLGGETAMTGVYAWRLDTRDLIAGFRHEYYGHVNLLK